MKNENKQPEYLTADELCKLNPIERTKYKAVCGALCTGGFQELTPDQIETYKKSHVTATIGYKLKQPDSMPESKEVESVPVKSFKAVQSCANSIDIVEIFDENERTITEIISAVEYVTTSNWKDANMIVNSLNASQFKTNPIEVIKKRLSELEMDKSSYTYAEYETKIYELTHILKLIQ